jgi:hypothetical protein
MKRAVLQSVRGRSREHREGLAKMYATQWPAAGLGQILPVDGHRHSQSTQLPATSTTAAAFFEPRNRQTSVDEWIQANCLSVHSDSWLRIKVWVATFAAFTSNHSNQGCDPFVYTNLHINSNCPSKSTTDLILGFVRSTACSQTCPKQR